MKKLNYTIFEQEDKTAGIEPDVVETPEMSTFQKVGVFLYNMLDTIDHPVETLFWPIEDAGINFFVRLKEQGKQGSSRDKTIARAKFLVLFPIVGIIYIILRAIYAFGELLFSPHKWWPKPIFGAICGVTFVTSFAIFFVLSLFSPLLYPPIVTEPFLFGISFAYLFGWIAFWSIFAPFTWIVTKFIGLFFWAAKWVVLSILRFIIGVIFGLN